VSKISLSLPKHTLSLSDTESGQCVIHSGEQGEVCAEIFCLPHTACASGELSGQTGRHLQR